MSFASAIRNWFGERGNRYFERGYFTDKTWRTNEFVEDKLHNVYRTKDDAAHMMLVQDEAWDKAKLMDALVTGSKEFKGLFLESLDEEEYNFHWKHQLTAAPIYLTEDPGLLLPPRRRQADFFANRKIHANMGRKYSGWRPPCDGIPLMRYLIRETIRLSGHQTTRGCAIAVPNGTAAEYLREAIGFTGIIINLECLDYPGLDNFPDWYLRHFRECGMETHASNLQAREDINLASPIRVCRPDGEYGYLHCTYRSVLVMRHWAQTWYPVVVNQKGLNDRMPGSIFNTERWTELWRIYMALRIRELLETFPDEPEHTWYERPPDHSDVAPPVDETYRREMLRRPVPQRPEQ